MNEAAHEFIISRLRDRHPDFLEESYLGRPEVRIPVAYIEEIVGDLLARSAAAPELADALEGFVTYHSGHVNTCPELAARMKAGRNAIAKARGEQPS